MMIISGNSYFLVSAFKTLEAVNHVNVEDADNCLDVSIVSQMQMM